MEGGAKKAPPAAKKKALPSKKPKPTKEEAAAAAATADAERKSSNRLSVYEFTSIIGMRATQLSKGAIPFVPLPEDMTIRTNMELREVALAELRAGRLPFMVRRKMPNGVYEVWKLADMHIPESFYERGHMYDQLRESIDAAGAAAVQQKA